MFLKSRRRVGWGFGHKAGFYKIGETGAGVNADGKEPIKRDCSIEKEKELST